MPGRMFLGSSVSVVVEAPTIIAIGTIDGTPTIGSTVTHINLTLGGGAADTIIRDWLGDGVSLGAPNSNTLDLTADMDGLDITVDVTVSNAGGSVNGDTPLVTAIYAAPQSSGNLPAITVVEDLPMSSISFASRVSVVGDPGLLGGTWSVQAGTVPAGLTRSGGVILAGTPTTPQASSTLTLRFSNSSGSFVDVSCDITITATVTAGIPSTAAAFWWDIQDDTTLWTTVDRTVQSTVGQPVAYIDDKIGTYDLSFTNGTAILRVDGVTGFNYLEVTTDTRAIIIGGENFCNNRAGAAIFAAVDNDDLIGEALFIQFQRSVANSSILDLRYVDGIPRATARRITTDAIAADDWTEVVDNRVVIASIVDWAVGNQVAIRVNGVTSSTPTALTGTGNSSAEDGLGGQVFNNTLTSQDWSGSVFGVVGFRTLPTSNDIIEVEAVLGNYVVGAPTTVTAPVASGTGIIGSSLSTTDGTWSVTPDTFEYRWKSNGVVIVNALSNQFDPTPAEDGTGVTAEVRAFKNGQPSAWVGSNSISIVYSVPVLSNITIIPAFGSQSTLFSYTFEGDIPGVVLTQQWQMNGTNIDGATGPTHQPTTDGNLTVEVTATSSGGSHTLESQIVVVVSGDIFGVTQGGTAVNVSSYNAPFPSYASGDLVVFVAGIESQGKTINFPIQTPGGEAIFPITANHNVVGSDITVSAVGWAGTATRASGTIAITVTGGADMFATAAIHVPSGSADDASPIDSIALGGSAVLATSSDTPSWLVTNVNATIVHVIMADGTAPSGIGVGYTANNIWTPGSVAAMVASRNARSSASETIPVTTVTFPSDEVWSGISFAFNVNGSPSLTRVPDCTILPLASIAGGTFGAVGNSISVTQGTWIGEPSDTEYRWLKDGIVIVGAVSNSYTPVSGDIGAVVVPQVRRQNVIGFGVWTSASNPATVVASGSSPSIAVLPQQFHVEDTGVKTLGVASFTTGDSPITYSRTPTNSAVTINSSTGLLSIDTANVIELTTFTITATNSSGSGNRTVQVQVTSAAVSGFFVAAGGSNGNAGTIGSPWATLQFAMDQLEPGDTLNIRDVGTLGGGNVNVSGTASQPITIQGYPGERPLLDGRIVTGERGTLSISAQDWLIFRNFDVIEGGRTASSGPGSMGVYVEGASGQMHGNILFEDMRAAFTNHSGFHIVGLQTGSTTAEGEYRIENVTVRNCELHDTNRSIGQEAITVGGGAQQIIIENNNIHDCGRYGIDFKLGFRRGIVRGNVIARSGHHGIYMDSASRLLEDVYIYDNLVFDAATNGLAIAREADRFPGAQDIRNMWVWNNVFARCARGILIYEHIWDDSSVGDFDNVRIFHNTMIDSDGTSARDIEFNSNIAPAIQGFVYGNNVTHGGLNPNINGFTGTSGYSAGGNVTSNPSFVNRAASPPNCRIPVGSAADNAGSATYLPVNMLSTASAWFLANATVTNNDAAGNVRPGSSPSAGAYEAV